MTTYVLVGGAWLGGWCWQPVARRLRDNRPSFLRARQRTRYAYHHGYFDGAERESRGFGMVEQFDTEEIGTAPHDETPCRATNLDESSYVPPVWTRTWFHTGAYLQGERISLQLAHEFYGAKPLGIRADQARLAVAARPAGLGAAAGDRPVLLPPAGGDLRPRLPWSLLPPLQVGEPDVALRGVVLYHDLLYLAFAE